MKITRLQMYEILEDWDRVSYFLHYINEWCDVFISIHPREWLTSWLRYAMRPAG